MPLEMSMTNMSMSDILLVLSESSLLSVIQREKIGSSSKGEKSGENENLIGYLMHASRSAHLEYLTPLSMRGHMGLEVQNSF